MLGHSVCSYTAVAAWFYFVIPPKNAKNVIYRFYRSELKNRCSFVVYYLTAGERFDRVNISCNSLHKVCD